MFSSSTYFSSLDSENQKAYKSKLTLKSGECLPSHGDRRLFTYFRLRYLEYYSISSVANVFFVYKLDR